MTAVTEACPVTAEEIEELDPLRFVVPGQATEADEPLTLGSLSLNKKIRLQSTRKTVNPENNLFSAYPAACPVIYTEEGNQVSTYRPSLSSWLVLSVDVEIFPS